jgi:hypothetical protein
MITALKLKVLGLLALAAFVVFAVSHRAEQPRMEAMKARQNAFTVGDTAKQVRDIQDR